MCDLDIVPSPEKLPKMFNQSRKEYLEDEVIDSFRRSDEDTTEEVLRESAEFIDQPVDSPNQRYPILFVDVNLGDERVERLTVFEGDQARDVAHDFCITHGLNERMEDKLEQMLNEQMAGILARINEEEEQQHNTSPEST